MKEPVRALKHPWLAAVAVGAIAAAYFALLSTSKYPEPGANLEYDIQTYADMDKIETRFSEVEQFVPDVEKPSAMAFADGLLYVAGKGEIAVHDGTATAIKRLKVSGDPNCLTVATDGSIFVGMPKYIEVVDKDGASQGTWDGPNARSYLTSIAVLEDDVFVADAGNRLVARYSRAGELLERIGLKDESRDVPGLEVPSPYLDLAVNGDGDLWVVNPGKLGLERFRSNGDIVTSWYRPWLTLDGFSGCCNPTQIAFTPDGKLVTCEKGLVRIKMYDVTSGEFEELVAGSGLFPREAPVRDVVVDGAGRILVIDPRNDSVRVFALKDTTDGTTTNQPA